MSSYRYSFQRVLDIRAKEKETAQLQVAQALQKLAKAESKFEQVFIELEEEEKKLFNQKTKVSISELRIRETYINQLRKKVLKEKEAVQLANRNVDKKQDLLQEKVKEEKKWSTHKEKLALQFLEDMKRQEQSKLDELSVQRFFRVQGLRSEELGRE